MRKTDFLGRFYYLSSLMVFIRLLYSFYFYLFQWFLFDLMFQAMYENLIPSFSKIYKIFEEKSSISNSEIFDFIRLAGVIYIVTLYTTLIFSAVDDLKAYVKKILFLGQMVLWIENDRSMLKMLLDAYLNEEKQIPAIQFSTFLKNEIANFDKKISS